MVALMVVPPPLPVIPELAMTMTTTCPPLSPRLHRRLLVHPRHRKLPPMHQVQTIMIRMNSYMLYLQATTPSYPKI